MSAHKRQAHNPKDLSFGFQRDNSGNQIKVKRVSVTPLQNKRFISVKNQEIIPEHLSDLNE